MDIEERYKKLLKIPDNFNFNKKPTKDNINKIEYISVIDTETTGLDFEYDKIWEIAIRMIEFNRETGEIISIVKEYNGFEDPIFPIPEFIKKKCHITEEVEKQIKGSQFDENTIRHIVTNSNLIVCHNSNFDRKFLEKRFPFFTDIPFVCSMSDIDWDKEDIESRKLEYICYKYNMWYEGHRAMTDVNALTFLLTQDTPITKQNILKLLYNRSLEESYLLVAYNSPFEVKDILKIYLKYKYFPQRKVWYKEIYDLVTLEKEKEILSKIYNTSLNPPIVKKINAKLRYSNRLLDDLLVVDFRDKDTK